MLNMFSLVMKDIIMDYLNGTLVVTVQQPSQPKKLIMSVMQGTICYEPK